MSQLQGITMTPKKPSRRNIRKLLARLNPKGMSLQPGAYGGIPNETALDIAAAAGMAGQVGDPQKLAVLTLCLRWWPGMFEAPMTEVGYRTIHHRRQHVGIDGTVLKWTEREKIAVEAPAELPAFQRMASLVATCIERRVHRDRDNFELNLIDQLKAEMHHQPRPPLRRLHARPVEDALADRIHASSDFLKRWARAVIHEYRNPNHCQACQMWGRVGEVPKAIMEMGKIVKIDWLTCETCLGQGVLPWSAHRRAQALVIGVHPFRAFLAAHHDGALSLLRTLEDRGAELLLKRLGPSD
jgi:hypothetical protein